MERWDAIEDAYHIAHDLDDEARTRFLQERCGSDAAMQRQIEVLLAQDNSLSHFLDLPAVDLAADARLRSGNAEELTGLRVGPSEVAELVGSGGMADVYRARAQAGARRRTEAPSFDVESDRLARFERGPGPRLMNHPNIPAIYGVEEWTPSAGQGGLVRALALELVEGPTLAGGSRRSIPVDEAVSIARQIMEALTARTSAIVHRDLRPANISSVGRRGQGSGFRARENWSLAEVTAAKSHKQSSDHRRGCHSQDSAYESGAVRRPTDKRSDVWAFGCVLCEMIIGGVRSRPRMSTTLAAVCAGTDWTLLQNGMPWRSTLIEAVCRGQQRQDRNISVARFLLTDRQIDAAAAPQMASRVSRWRRAAALAAVAAIGATLGGIVVWLDSNATNEPQVRFGVAPAPGTAFGTREQPSSPAISPDGTRLVFVVLQKGEPLLAIRATDALEAQVLPGTEGARFPFWSADSRTIAFFAGGELRTVDAASGRIQTICNAPGGAGGGTWNAQG